MKFQKIFEASDRILLIGFLFSSEKFEKHKTIEHGCVTLKYYLYLYFEPVLFIHRQFHTRRRYIYIYKYIYIYICIYLHFKIISPNQDVLEQILNKKSNFYFSQIFRLFYVTVCVDEAL